MTVRVEVQPQLLEWARARSGIDEAIWTKRFPLFDKWVAGERVPTLKQLEEFARKTYTPVGYFFLDQPPHEAVPIDDFRTMRDRPVSPEFQVVPADLLDTLYVSQARQEWYRHHQLLNGEPPLSFLDGTATVDTPSVEVATEMRSRLKWGSESRNRFSSSDAALTGLRNNAEDIGVLVMISGIVGSNTHRKLDPEMFRGFALSDPYAPLVFVNGADSKTAQIFTLAHEIAHLWLGSSALSDAEPESTQEFDVERWCNQVAAELLVPIEEFADAYDRDTAMREQLQPLAKKFCVSTQVVLGRVREIGVLTWDNFMIELDHERQRIAEITSRKRQGGTYYNTKPVQVSRRFARELITSTLEGRTTYTEAFRLLTVKKTSTFYRLAKELGVS